MADIKPNIETKPSVDSKPSTSKGGRKGWDKDEWAAKAKAKDEEGVERAKAAEAAMKQGKRPPRPKEDDTPKPTKALEARTEDLGIEKNLNKTVLVQTTTTGHGPRGAGFYCDMCNRTLKDSLSYLDHVNGRTHLAKLGQTTQVTRSTLSQVREKIRLLRESTNTKVTAKNYDFQARLNAVREVEQSEKARRKEERKRKREGRREEEALARVGVLGKRSKLDSAGALGRDVEGEVDGEVERATAENRGLEMMMGFGGFGGVRKR